MSKFLHILLMLLVWPAIVAGFLWEATTRGFIVGQIIFDEFMEYINPYDPEQYD